MTLFFSVSVPTPKIAVTASPSSTVNVGSSVVLMCVIWDVPISLSFRCSWDRVLGNGYSVGFGNSSTLIRNISTPHVQKEEEGVYHCACTLERSHANIYYISGAVTFETIDLKVSGTRNV